MEKKGKLDVLGWDWKKRKENTSTAVCRHCTVWGRLFIGRKYWNIYLIVILVKVYIFVEGYDVLNN